MANSPSKLRRTSRHHPSLPAGCHKQALFPKERSCGVNKSLAARSVHANLCVPPRVDGAREVPGCISSCRNSFSFCLIWTSSMNFFRFLSRGSLAGWLLDLMPLDSKQQKTCCVVNCREGCSLSKLLLKEICSLLQKQYQALKVRVSGCVDTYWNNALG